MPKGIDEIEQPDSVEYASEIKFTGRFHPDKGQSHHQTIHYCEAPGCTFESKYRKCIKEHVKIHLGCFECFCGFVCKSRRLLNAHQKQHDYFIVVERSFDSGNRFLVSSSAEDYKIEYKETYTVSLCAGSWAVRSGTSKL
jgi:hypothetical protein